MENLHSFTTLAGGCFWCTEAIFKSLKGVISAVPGYTGGNIDNPTYEQVSSGDSGHAEAVRVEYDPKVISLHDLLYVFFKLHDPTTLNRQGADIGPQYRSEIFFENNDQREVAEEVKNKMQSEYKDPIVTKITKFKKFFPAEEYHRDYYFKNSSQPYCKLVIDPKIQKLKLDFKKLLK